MARNNTRKKRFDYGLSLPPSQQNLAEGADPIALDVKVYPILRSGIDTPKLADHPGPPCLIGAIDWQDGLSIHEATGIDPSAFITLSETTHAALRAARAAIGATWNASEPQGEPACDWEAPDLMFITSRRLEALNSLNGGPDALGVYFSIHGVSRWKDEAGAVVEDLDESPKLQGVVDGKHGITLHKQEHIEPGEFISIMACAHEAIVSARVLIGSNWRCSEPQADPVPENS